VALGAEMNAQQTFFAKFFVDFYMSFQNQTPKNNLRCYLAYNEKKVKFFKRKK
jgi:hypothetical protein